MLTEGDSASGCQEDTSNDDIQQYQNYEKGKGNNKTNVCYLIEA